MGLKKKTLSVIVPSYNVEKYLRRCLDSLLYDEKCHADLEILVVNDGSTDNTAEIARDYAERYQPGTVRLIDKANGGHGSTLNAGIAQVSGKYFKIIDADDWVNIKDFGLFIEELKSREEDLVLTNYTDEKIVESWAEGTLRGYDGLDYANTYALATFDYQQMLPQYFTMATVTYKTEAYKKSQVKISEKCNYVDMEFVIFPLQKMTNFVYLNYNIYRYFLGRADQSMNSQKMMKNRADHRRVLLNTVRFYQTIPDKQHNLRHYVGTLIKYMIMTHHNIYLRMGNSVSKSARTELRQLDRVLQREIPEIFKATLKEAAYIRLNYHTNFSFVRGRVHPLATIGFIYDRKYLVKTFLWRIISRSGTL